MRPTRRKNLCELVHYVRSLFEVYGHDEHGLKFKSNRIKLHLVVHQLAIAKIECLCTALRLSSICSQHRQILYYTIRNIVYLRSNFFDLRIPHLRMSS